MTPLEKAAQQALEALEIHCSFAKRDKPGAMDIGVEAITALREALSGVQALSAAPAMDIATVGEAQAFEAWYKQDCVIEGAAAKMAAKAAWKARAMLAASPTPPAEQQAQPSGAVYSELPELTSTEINDACWAFVEAMPHNLPGPIWNDLKPAVYAAICKFLQAAPMAAPQQEAQEPGEIPESIERMATGRYKVVPSHESMFHRWAVVAGSGTQQLYLGREVECQNMARKFAGAFLDGAFVAMQSTAPQPAPAPLSEQDEEAAMYRWLRAQHEDDSGEPRCCVYAPNDMRECLVPVGDMPGELDTFIRAALAAQGGK